jgi:pimeloyl-ACP methyl ester carboxylesterase
VFASRRTLPLDGLIIMNVPHPKVFRDAMRRPSRQWLRSWYTLFFQLPWLPEALLRANNARAIAEAFSGMAIDKSRFPAAVTDHYRANAMVPGALTAMINYYRANIRAIEAEPAPMIDTPTLMIWGEEDAALGIELTEGYDALVRDFTLHRLPGVSHWVQQEAPEAVNAILKEWLSARAMIRA